MKYYIIYTEKTETGQIMTHDAILTHENAVKLFAKKGLKLVRLTNVWETEDKQ